MQKSPALKRMLEDMTVQYNAGTMVPVELEDTSSYAKESGEVAVATNLTPTLGNVSGPEELKAICNTLSHEVEHVRESELDVKRKFMARYPDYFRETAGLVVNVLEDQYVDANRLSRFQGLRPVQKWEVSKIMSNDKVRPSIDELSPEGQLAEGFLQIAFSGSAKGYSNADSDVKDFLAWSRRHIGVARRTDDPLIREAIAARVADRMLEEFRDPSEIDQNELSGIAENAPTEEIDPDEADGQEPYEPDDETTETIEMLVESGDLPEDDEDFDDDEDGSGSGDGDEAEESDENGDSESGDGDGDSDEDEDEDAQNGENGDENDDSDEDDSSDPLDEEKDALEEQSSWYGDDDEDEDAFDADEAAWERRYEQLQAEQAKNETPLEQRRDERDANAANSYSPISHETVREYMKQQGIDDEIVEAFSQVKIAPTPLPSEVGDRLNIRNYIRYKSGDVSESRFFEESAVTELGGRGIGVALDMSGSMGKNHKVAKAALAALAIAAGVVDDHFVATAFDTVEAQTLSKTHGYTARTRAITLPGEEFEWEQLDAVSPGNLTPVADGMIDAAEMLDAEATRSDVLFVVTDGASNITLDGRQTSNAALAEARQYTEELRAKGVAVIGFGIGSGVKDRDLETMFGKQYIHCSVEELADELLAAYVEQLDVKPEGF